MSRETEAGGVRRDFPPDYERRSRDILERALDGVAVYGPWKALDPGPARALDERFAVLPALTKRDIRENFPAGMFPPGTDLERALAGKAVSLVETSGTTDEKITNVWNQAWWDASEKASWGYNSALAGLDYETHREAVLANPRNVGFISDDRDLPMDERRLARFLYLNEKSDPPAWTEGLMRRMLRELELFRPEVLEANPSLLARLSRFTAARGLAAYQPKAVVLTYEYITGLQMRQIRRVFSAPLVSSYGTTETGYVFMQCEAGRFHQNSDLCRVDFQPFRKEFGGPDLGRILVTPLGNPWCWFLRFDTGDLVTIDREHMCPCGRNSGLVLSATSGRKANLTLAVDGRPVTLAELDAAMTRLDGIEQYKLIQTDRRTYELRLVVQEGPDASAAGPAAEKALKNIYGSGAAVDLVFERDIKPEISGKYIHARALFPIDLEEYLERRPGPGSPKT